MVDVALMRDLGPIPSIFSITSHVARRKLDLSSSVPSGVAKKCVDVGCGPNHTLERALDA
jgi:trans-aconitate methyltransferase